MYCAVTMWQRFLLLIENFWSCFLHDNSVLEDWTCQKSNKKTFLAWVWFISLTMSVSLQSDIGNYWPGMHDTAVLVIFAKIILTLQLT